MAKAMAARSLLFNRQARFALFYGAFYLGFGAYLPYMPVWFETRGLSPELIGAAAAASMAGRVIAAPLGALLADRAPRRRTAVVAFALAALFAFIAHVPATAPWLIVVLAGLAGAAFTGVIPIIDAFAIGESRRRGFAFGPPRALGSATFIVGNIACGALISAFGGEAALAWTLTGAGIAVAAALVLPEGRKTSVTPTERGDRSLTAVLLAGGLPLAFAASALVQGAHGFYYAFSAVAWRADGVPATAVGLLWATGVGAEIVFLAVSARLMKTLSPAGLLALGAAASVVRWIALAFSPPLWALFGLQLLHAFSFGASYLGFLRFASETAPERYAATAQAVNSALSGGLVLAAATYASGFAYAGLGTAGFALMAIPAGLGFMFAVWLARASRTAP